MQVIGVLCADRQHTALGDAEGDRPTERLQAGRQLLCTIPVAAGRSACQRDHINTYRSIPPVAGATKDELLIFKGQIHPAIRRNGQHRGECLPHFFGVRQHGKAVGNGLEQRVRVDIATLHEAGAEKKVFLEKDDAFSCCADAEFIFVFTHPREFSQRESRD